jgi:hypothetical protein
MAMQFIRPSGGPEHQVLHPHGRPLAPEGETVAWCSYWVRQLRAGAIRLDPAPAPAPALVGGADPAPALVGAADPDPALLGSAAPASSTKRRTALLIDPQEVRHD